MASLIATELASVSLDFFSSFNQMQSTVPMKSNMLTLTVGIPDLGWVKEAAPLLWRMLREAIVSPLFVGIEDGEGENGFLVSYFGDVPDDESVAIGV